MIQQDILHLCQHPLFADDNGNKLVYSITFNVNINDSHGIFTQNTHENNKYKGEFAYSVSLYYHINNNCFTDF